MMLKYGQAVAEFTSIFQLILKPITKSLLDDKSYEKSREIVFMT
jgi:hypothetical protein